MYTLLKNWLEFSGLELYLNIHFSFYINNNILKDEINADIKKGIKRNYIIVHV